ncbi:molybdate transport system regulatory protein [Novimethylophilus kurashikiensis]|uniref:Molybdate transport system regulatory protein n=1 Tax=Novimethylophilus kurashikiensis TaxID=1825523 RepID=A0A2R5F9F3_9PROT|nr:TOBE domain-containing protein [Novimethylophilus kurashikiensis]GBG14665.1 molybdate transport system regulatory protein [Novimethylophilus kurashikiensis]
MSESELKVMGSLALGKDEQHVLSDKRIALLEHIAQCGSITQAAKAAGLSYKGAWDAVDAMNSMFDEPLVATATGGKGGGGTQLTGLGVRMVDAYRALRREQKRFLEAASSGIADFDNVYQLIRRLSVKTSARNQFFGKVTAIKKGPVNIEVELTLTGGDRIYSVITHDGLETLNGEVGSDAWALVNAAWIILTLPDVMGKTSARNSLLGRVVRINTGIVNSEVVLQLDGGNTVSAVVTNESVEALGLEPDVKICAVFKASSVILGVTD